MFLRSVTVNALVLCIGLVGRAVLQPEGWGQRVWGLSPYSVISYDGW